MEALFLSWLFDSRWLCTLPNPCFEFILVVPVVANLATIVTMFYERSMVKVEVESSFVMLITLYAFLAVLDLLLLGKIYQEAERKLQGARENYEVIRSFTHSFEAKKGVWGWKGFCIICLSLIQLGINRYYIDANLQIYGCYANLTRFYLDVAAWGYIALVVLCFILCKLAFLMFAWRHPEKYLKFKEII